MTKEATRAIKDLKNKRKAKEERMTQRVSSSSSFGMTSKKESLTRLQAARRTNRRLSGGSSASTESGEISERDTFRHKSASPVRRPVVKKPENKDIDLDVAQAVCREVNSARLSRYEIVDILHKDGFEDVATGEPSCFPVRVVADGCQAPWLG
jgi:RNA polymerase-associated protein RTF1